MLGKPFAELQQARSKFVHGHGIGGFVTGFAHADLMLRGEPADD